MLALEAMIKKLKEQERINYLFMRRRIEKGNGKRTLGWVVKKDNVEKTEENIDINKLFDIKDKM